MALGSVHATAVAQDDWVTVRISRDLVQALDNIRAQAGQGYTSRADVLAAAIRFFVQASPEARSITTAQEQRLVTALKAVQLAKPKNVQAFIEAMLRELDDAPAAPREPGRRRPWLPPQ